ncbi:MAG: hypothetical protein J6Q13_03355 [Clostridia bacterium]|nr:hypothetical protein [Clostridia bacterium]
MKKINIFILLLCLFVPLSFVGCENKNKNSLATPTIVDIKGGTIVFDSVPDAEYYTLSINDNEITVYASHNNYVQIIDNKINYDASKIFVVGDSYSVKVRANAEKKNSSSFSKEFSYKHTGTILKPTSVKINGTTLTWDTVENAGNYLVKIVTPNDNVIFDKFGNVLTQDDSYSISIADLTEYSFNTNQFDFASLLSKAGNYKFYVCAVSTDGISTVESGYTSKVSYNHTVTLSTPVNGEIYKVDNQLHMLCAVDTNANGISIICNGIENSVEINKASTDTITKLNNNFLDINLNEYFKNQVSAGKLNFNSLQQFSFATQSKFISTNLDNSYYLNSDYSTPVVFENTDILPQPVLTLEYDNLTSYHIASWNSYEHDYIGEFKVLVATATEVKEYKLDDNIKSMLISEDFVTVAVQAIGVGSYLSSPLSNFVSNTSLTGSLPSLTATSTNTSVSWNDIATYYIVEQNNEFVIKNTTSYNVNFNNLNFKDNVVKITAIKENYKSTTKTLSNVQPSMQLATPTFSYSQGFTSSKLYELTFTGVENAIGYYVHIKAKDATEYEKINILYTSTAIDLSQYIISEGDYTDYEVKVQAVADIHSTYTNSELSSSVNVSHKKVLDTPEFYKVGNTTVPVTKQVSGGITKYILKFYGVESAGSYEILINYNKYTVNTKSKDYTGLYSVDISSFLIAANNYEIKIKAIPVDSAVNVDASDYAISNYALTKQLSTVTNIQITESNGVHTLTFDPVNNAENYRVRVVKENDGAYADYLLAHNLNNPFIASQSEDISKYVKEQGAYYFYVTALAPSGNSYYADANESTTYGYVDKLNSLPAPTNIQFTNKNKDDFWLSWEVLYFDGENYINYKDKVDYYFVKITDPNGISYEFKEYNPADIVIGETTYLSTNINEYITIQGTYYVQIYSMVDAVGTNASLYTSSHAGTPDEDLYYTYQTKEDFFRYSIYMYGNEYDFVIDNIEDLKNQLWYHYLYNIDIETGLNLYINLQQKEDDSYETLNEAIIRLAQEANDNLIHPFNNDEQWELLTTDNKLFAYLCEKVLLAYPEFNILDDSFVLEHEENSQIFNLKYSNKLNTEKVNLSEISNIKQVKDEHNNIISTVSVNTNYGNYYNYIDLYSRKSATGVFNIDSKPDMLVETTEQLLQAVQHGKKPKFIGDSQTAETVYKNAKLVLSAIVTNNMTDLEKVTVIFDWLEYGFDLTYYKNISNATLLSGSTELANLKTYAKYKHYYLEGIFEDISMLPNGDIVIGSNLATSWSYSKAFTLLCAIEGIQSTIVHGTYSKSETISNINHVWNKVYLNTSVDGTEKHWYVVDLTLSDNRIMFNDLKSGYGIASHTHFLISDSLHKDLLSFTDLTDKSTVYQTEKKCDLSYDYYQNSSFGLTYKQIQNTITDFEIYETDENGAPILLTESFNYSKKFSPSVEYQKYSQTTAYGELATFLINAMIYAEYMANQNLEETGTVGRSVIEFKFNHDDLGTSTFNLKTLKDLYDLEPYQIGADLVLEGNAVYTVQDNSTTTVIFVVEKTA